MFHLDRQTNGKADVTKQKVAFRIFVNAAGYYSGPLGLESKPTSV